MSATAMVAVEDLRVGMFVHLDVGWMSHPFPLSSFKISSIEQIEVIRGPATLRYGSTAIGGVVSATNNRIPDALPPCAQPFQSYGLAKPPTLFGGAGRNWYFARETGSTRKDTVLRRKTTERTTRI